MLEFETGTEHAANMTAVIHYQLRPLPPAEEIEVSLPLP